MNDFLIVFYCLIGGFAFFIITGLASLYFLVDLEKLKLYLVKKEEILNFEKQTFLETLTMLHYAHILLSCPKFLKKINDGDF